MNINTFNFNFYVLISCDIFGTLVKLLPHSMEVLRWWYYYPCFNYLLGGIYNLHEPISKIIEQLWRSHTGWPCLLLEGDASVSDAIYGSDNGLAPD